MKILSFGVVLIAEEGIIVKDFVVEGGTSQELGQFALEWAAAQIEEARKKPPIEIPESALDQLELPFDN